MGTVHIIEDCTPERVPRTAFCQLAAQSPTSPFNIPSFPPKSTISPSPLPPAPLAFWPQWTYRIFDSYFLARKVSGVKANLFLDSGKIPFIISLLFPPLLSPMLPPSYPHFPLLSPSFPLPIPPLSPPPQTRQISGDPLVLCPRRSAESPCQPGMVRLPQSPSIWQLSPGSPGGREDRSPPQPHPQVFLFPLFSPLFWALIFFNSTYFYHFLRFLVEVEKLKCRGCQVGLNGG